MKRIHGESGEFDEEEGLQAQSKDRRRRLPFYLESPLGFTFTWNRPLSSRCGVDVVGGGGGFRILDAGNPAKVLNGWQVGACVRACVRACVCVCACVPCAHVHVCLWGPVWACSVRLCRCMRMSTCAHVRAYMGIGICRCAKCVCLDCLWSGLFIVVPIRYATSHQYIRG